MKIKDIPRILLRLILGSLCSLAVKKHKPKIIAIKGDYSPSLYRERIYHMISSRYNTRQNLERTEREFSIPLTVLGTLQYPGSLLEWIYLVVKTTLQIIYLKPYKHFIVIQINYINKAISEYWMAILKPELIIKTQEIDDSKGIEDKQIKYLIRHFGLDRQKASQVWQSAEPAPRINVISGKNGSMIIDATHYYHPPNIKSVIELANLFQGKKHILTKIKLDSTKIPANYTIHKSTKNFPNPSRNVVYIIRGNKDKNLEIIRKLSLNELEI